jgi:diguanylate cyclase (GGDEF)-like protein
LECYYQIPKLKMLCDLNDKLNMNITASLGVAEYQLKLKNLDELLKNADTAMYKAKNKGRNRVELFTGEAT